MQDISLLSDLPIGKESKIETLSLSSDIRQRLIDLGFVKGTNIKCVLKNPSGETFAFLIRQTLIALRKEDAEKISVTL